MAIRPKLAVAFANVVFYWSRAEHDLTLLLIKCLGIDADIQIRTFFEKRDTRGKSGELKRLIEGRVSSSLQDTVVELLERFEKLSKRRNSLVHAQWYISKDFPESLIWADPDKENELIARYWSRHITADPKLVRASHPSDDFEWNRDHLQIYDEKDFNKLSNDINRICLDLSATRLECEREVRKGLSIGS